METPFQLEVNIDRDSTIPLYQQIVDPFEDAIAQGLVSPGQLVEDEISMAKRLDVSRPTLRRALQELVNRGLLVRRRGIGTRVAPSQIHRPVELSSLNHDLVEAGYTPSTRVTSYQVVPSSDEVAKDLGINPGEGTLHVIRIRSIDDRPLAILRNYLPLDIAPSWGELHEKGLYECFAPRDIKVASANQTIGTRPATEEEAEMLKVAVGSPVLTMDRIAFTKEGRVVELGNHVYNPELYSFRFTVFTN
ncbi:UbiC transcription regulator-associated domain protein [Gleimia coleocanis DSM 15436]|uniref:UbiC transcription regulator-associated domain protein n=1 Tax=Gleimia coleocanis DSM 15436 TaxID=525245 RepID=C0VXX2_9ACTO|nr:GntR family transcriptional regulator [Gleimia coleocanis]EEH64275.1 UbiC transcription regulator-associated domain protein [Gleimia coleocanis DSM 15436]